MKTKAIEYGRKACDTMMHRWAAADLPPKGGFHYHQGVFLSGMMNLYEVCKDEKYLSYTKEWVDSIIIDDGTICRFTKGCLDDYMAGILLFPLYDRFKENKYLTALHLFEGIIHNWLRNKAGGFWHMERMVEQMWLDGLYMVGPLQAMYAKKFDNPRALNDAIEQVHIMYDNMQDDNTKLLYHAWHCAHEAPLVEWADEKTGLSSEFWGRAMGWYVVAILDIMEQMDKNHPEYSELAKIEREVLGAVIKHQDEKSGMWYQVIDKGDWEGNWLETSCSCLFTYAIAKAMRMGVIEKNYYTNIEKAFNGILDHSITTENGELCVNNVCIGTGVCDYKGYIERPTSTNDLHGMGAFLLMCAELGRIE